MATKPVDGHRHAHHAHHHHHRAHQGQHAHQGQQAHNGGDKPTKTDKPVKTDKPTQAPQAGKPPQVAAGAPPPTPQKPKDQYTPQIPPPVDLAPGATGEHKPPVMAPLPAGQAATPLPAAGQAATPPPAAGQAATPLPAAGQAATPLPAAGQTATPLPAAGQAAAPIPVALPSAPAQPQFQWISQLEPTGFTDTYENGAMNCGPTAGAMIGRACGYGEALSDVQLVDKLADVGLTDGAGTTGNGMIAMYEEMGLETAAIPGADMSWINSQLAAGHYVTALGDYYAVPGRIDDSQTAGHYMDVTAYEAASQAQAARYSVADPANEALKYLSIAELQTFVNSAPSGGGFCISCWEAAAAAAAVL